MAGVAALVRDGLVPSGCYRNRDYYSEFVALEEKMFVDDALLPLFDPQTSGGLLIALSPQSADRFLQLAAAKDCFAVRIGEVVGRRERPIELF
jgi:selenide,water dikinase